MPLNLSLVKSYQLDSKWPVLDIGNQRPLPLAKAYFRALTEQFQSSFRAVSEQFQTCLSIATGAGQKLIMHLKKRKLELNN